MSEIDYAEEYMKLKNKEQWLDDSSLKNLKESATKERFVFNSFVRYKIEEAVRKYKEDEIKFLDELKIYLSDRDAMEMVDIEIEKLKKEMK